MKLLQGVPPLAVFNQGVVATIGNFDGVHLGHQKLILSLRQKAHDLNLPLVVLLFEPQPREYFYKQDAPARLSSLREKLESLKQQQVDVVCCIRFNQALTQTTAYDFAKLYLFASLKVKYLLVGNDFRFGKNREGDVNFLKTLGKQHGCEVQIHEDFCIQQEKVSSTLIRSALQQGDLDLAKKYLGRVYSLCSRVIRGDGRGRLWGLPTANLNLKRLTLPLRGVFVVQVNSGSNLFQGVANIGTRPTLEGMEDRLEVHLFDFDACLYGKLLKVFFLHKLRDEMKFPSVDALILQIQNDIVSAKAFLEAIPS